MQRRTVIKTLAAALPGLFFLKRGVAFDHLGAFGQDGAFVKGPFKPNWDSLQKYEVPEWFRDAKFGIWAHWGPQCEPERGDWYARGMYQEGSDQYSYHCKKYGHPSKFGFKDVINVWKADKWDPEELVAFYKKAGAKYFMALANHHDDFDLYDSTYQPWNSTKLGPKKDLIAGWAKAAKKNGLTFGVSVHAAHAWSWYETAQRSDKKGPLKGVSYDGRVARKDGKGKWWNGYDPQVDLYAQNHALSENSLDDGEIHRQWNWGNGVTPPSDAYCEKFYRRTIELIDKYSPELVYFDDTVLPFYPINDKGVQIAAHLYNKTIKDNGKLTGVVTGKILNEQQRKCMVWDIERGQSNEIEPIPWQTDTCIGSWHYDRRLYDNNQYKTAKTVIHILVDVVSKNGNLMLNIPIRGDGTIDDKERAVVESIGKWMMVNSEGIYASRPWKVFGEGPAIESAAPLSAQGFNEGKGKPLGAHDFRFTCKGNTLYAFMLGWPGGQAALIKKLAQGNGVGRIKTVQLLGANGNCRFEQTAGGLRIDLPEPGELKDAYVFKIEGAIV
ncbi:alpha-L-fucosidase [Arachidicoccus ginsenosidivorans]|jgi:alpha-L-fucosidase|uniref:alpha-L-fucosidase n=1 Tax=Arachidicoccus ginsenosidivorans TaxID=496057 RepID=A0A5B8VJA1_9BACT|nr:alpha-L-fucosidase [Arachidicoccus ginsenosidivorans]QEC70666.1 alpha-L-fucosidase [Arachidicoccus ginsenosidivorans]